MEQGICLAMPETALSSFRRHGKAALFAAILSLFAIQIVSAAHAAKFGDAPHNHNGHECVLSQFSTGGDKAIAASAFALVAAVAIWRVSGRVAQTELARIAIRAAQPRGPPLL